MAIGHWLFAERWLLAIGYSRSVGYWLFAQCWLFVTPYYASTEMSKIHFDLIVFGGGNAISTAIECGQAGMKVALRERGPLGGNCPHRGWIPSKVMIWSRGA